MASVKAVETLTRLKSDVTSSVELQEQKANLKGHST